MQPARNSGIAAAAESACKTKNKGRRRSHCYLVPADMQSSRVGRNLTAGLINGFIISTKLFEAFFVLLSYSDVIIFHLTIILILLTTEHEAVHGYFCDPSRTCLKASTSHLTLVLLVPGRGTIRLLVSTSDETATRFTTWKQGF